MGKKKKAEASDDLDEFLTKDEQLVLKKAIDSVRDEIIKKTLSRIRNYMITAGVILTGFGLISLSSIRSDIVKVVSEKLAGDEKVKKMISDKTALILKDTTEIHQRIVAQEKALKQKHDNLERDLENEISTITSSLTADFKEIKDMAVQMREEVSNLRKENQNESE